MSVKRVRLSLNANTMSMNTAKKNRKSFVITILLSVLIMALAVAAFIPTLFSSNARTEATSSLSDINAEAMNVLEYCSDYVAKNNFSTGMNGAIKASVIGVPYTQKIHGSRTVNIQNNTYTEVAESVSALVKAALRRERRDGAFYVSHGNYKNKKFRYGDEHQLTQTDYVAQYGQPFTGIVKYDLDGTIIATEKIDENTYCYTLDPTRATQYSRNEVMTMLGGKSYPEYKSVTFTIITDGYRPIKVKCTEKFKIDKFGGTSCTAEYNETFRFNSEL